MNNNSKWYDKITFTNLFCFIVFNWCMVFFFYIMHQSFNNPKAELPNEADQIMIAVIGFGSAVIGFVVGNSANAKRKDESLDKAINNMPSSAVKNNTGDVIVNNPIEDKTKNNGGV